MTEPVTAAAVLLAAIERYVWPSEDDALDPADAWLDAGEYGVSALREACGGGDIVIRTDGTIWRLELRVGIRGQALYGVIPVEREA